MGKAAALFIPHPTFMTERTQDGAARLGLEVNAKMIESERPEMLFGLACDAAQIDRHSVIDEYRERATRQDLFFPLDMHFNAEGNRVFAELIAPFVKEQLGVQ